jgi:hypothetical protein
VCSGFISLNGTSSSFVPREIDTNCQSRIIIQFHTIASNLKKNVLTCARAIFQNDNSCSEEVLPFDGLIISRDLGQR